MMDMVASCKDKLTSFRIKELKDVLTQLGLSKQGKKQELIDRILGILSDGRGAWAKKNTVGKDEVAKLVDDTYRNKLSVTAQLRDNNPDTIQAQSNSAIIEETQNEQVQEGARERRPPSWLKDYVT